MAGRRRANRTILIVIGVLVGLIVLCGLVGLIVGGDQEDDETTAPPTYTADLTSPAVPSPGTTAPLAPAAPPAPPAPTEPAAPPPPAGPVAYSDPRCAPAAAELVAQVAAGLTTEGHQLANGTVITENGVTYFGATTMDAMGEMDSRSDVWIVRDGEVFSSTGGARNQTSFPRASAALGISPGDPNVTAVDTCVVDLTS